MSALHLNQIRSHLTANYEPHLRLEGADQPHHRLSRGMAAAAVAITTGLSSELSAAAVTDDTDDGGIDAVAYAADRSTLVLVQSKWSDTGNGFELGDVLKFLDGVKHLINSDFSVFGGPILARKNEIEALLGQAGTRVELVLVTSSTALLAGPQRNALDELCADMNDSSELATSLYLDQGAVYEWIASPQHDRPDLAVTLRNWGAYSVGQYVAYYGTASAQDVIQWYRDNGTRLFSSNIRVDIGGSDVNDGIVATADEDASRFWFFNNGVTVVAKSFEQTPTVNQRSGGFLFRQASVVNGAQTVSSLARAAAISDNVIENADVFLRIVTLDDPNGEFARLVTRRTNTQNRVGAREFVSQDPEQARLRTEFAVAGYEYVYMTGETVEDYERGCDLTEATAALACAYRVNEAVLLKREIGALWADVQSAPYKALFNASVSGSQVWSAVLLMRQVEEELRRVRETSFEGRDWLVLRHGNRLVNWAVAQRLGPDALRASLDFAPVFSRATVASAVEFLAPRLVDVVASRYGDSYPLPLFRNLTKTQAVAAELMR